MLYRVTPRPGTRLDYQPKTLIIKSGDSVVWTNNGHMGHTASRDLVPKFDTKGIAPGATSEPVVLNGSPGTVLDYFCRPHRGHDERKN
ncbi:cupredoxin domain-containing protein [Bradyrhizobium sp. HKCCYLR20261]|uniref:cupredoxin domain-containing protein n=1 Tax=Bradyrhizobium sp. HKCCYLR20261 TaxID=3420760 RepID=UPI003EBC3C14